MSIGAIIALVVIVVVIIGFLIALPSWAVLALIGALAVAILLGGVVVPWRVG